MHEDNFAFKLPFNENRPSKLSKREILTQKYFE